MSLLMLAVALLPAVLAPMGAAQESKAQQVNQGTLQFGAKTFRLTHALAYQTKDFGQMASVVIMTEKPIAAKTIQGLREALKKGKDDGFWWVDLPTPWVKLTLTPNSPPFLNVSVDSSSI